MGFAECARTRGCNMFPHYMVFAGWLALAVVCTAWVALAVYLTFVVVAQASTSPSGKARWVTAFWLLPAIGIAAFLVTRRTQRPRAMVGHNSGRSRDQ